MHANDYWLIAAFFILVLAPAPWLGRYLYRAMEGERTWLTPVFQPVERLCYRIAGIDQEREQNWMSYCLALLGLTALSLLGLLSMLMLQGQLPLNPQQLPGLEWHLALNTAVSFVTNTNWQAYSGEAQLSYFSQMLGLGVQNFVSPAVGLAELSYAALLSSLADDTAEGKSIVEYLRALSPMAEPSTQNISNIPFSAETRLSGADHQGRRYRKGAVDAVLDHLGMTREEVPPVLAREVEKIAQSGGTPLLVCADDHLLGAIHLKDVVKPGIRERFAELRQLGIRTVMVTGDNPLTAAAIAAEAGVDDLIAEATPQKKLQRIRQEQAEGKMVAMCGDGANDAPALAQADVGMAMNDGTQAAREAANLVDLDSDPTKLLDVVQVGKQLLVTRGALTTFSIANDVAKYFAILPALFIGIYPQLSALNLMQLHSPESAILSAIVFNALIIVVLIPLALRGVRIKAADAASLLRRNLLLYGLGGLLAPFVGIKLIDLLLTATGLV